MRRQVAFLMSILVGLLSLAYAADSTPPSAETLATVQSQLDAILCRHNSLPEPPTVVLAGHHNDGKSALLEALLGLRLCHVGASTSTRRPLRIHAHHDADCDEPLIHLRRDGAATAGDPNLGERVTVADVRAYVEAENARLAAAGEVDDTEIRVDLRWRLAPNLVLVDTPGLLSLPAGSEIADAALARTSEAAERVLLKQLASSPSRLCLCLEDTADWQLSPTCAVVSRADPQLSRTLLVATKLDGKLRQFSMAEDLHRLLNPPTVAAAHPKLLGGPIFTCVPPTRDQSPQALHEAVAREEAAMRKLLVDRLGSDVYSSRIGVHALRAELQPHVDARWAELLHTASQSIDMQLTNLQKMLQAPPEVEGESLDDFVHRFCLAVHQLIKGSIALPPSSHGETLQQEQSSSNSGPLCEIKRPNSELRRAAVDAAGRPASTDLHVRGAEPVGEAAMLASAAASAEKGEDAARDEALLWLHAGKRLYGGAQYYRALQEFMLGASQGSHEEISVEEIVNAMGVDGYHDGVNYMHAVCVLVIEKARGYFETALARLRIRMLHIMSRLSGLADELMLADAAAVNAAAARASPDEGEDEGLSPAASAAAAAAQRGAARSRGGGPFGLFDEVRPASPIEHARYMGLVAPVFQRFVQRTMASTMEQCESDVGAMTRYVSWDFNSPTRDALQNLLVEPVHQALEARLAANAATAKEGGRRGKRRKAVEDALNNGISSVDELVASFTETLVTRRVTEPIRLLMSELVTEVIRAWREEFCRTISLKLNAGFLLPFCEALPNYMRKEVGKHARSMGIDEHAPSEGGSGAAVSEGDGDGARVLSGLDARTAKLRQSIEERLEEKSMLQRIATRMRVGAPPRPMKEM